MLNDNEGYIMKVIYSVLAEFDGSLTEIGLCKTLDDAIQMVRRSSLEDGCCFYKIQTLQCVSTLSCRVIDHQLFIE